MSKPKNYWYGFVKNNIVGRVGELDINNDMEFKFLSAYAKALEKTAEMPNSDERIKTIQMIFIKKTDTVESLTFKLYWSERTIRGWVSDFINMVGEEAGFPCINKP